MERIRSILGLGCTGLRKHPAAFVPPRALTAEHREIWVALIAIFKLMQDSGKPQKEILEVLRHTRSKIQNASDVDEAFTRMFGKSASEGM